MKPKVREKAWQASEHSDNARSAIQIYKPSGWQASSKSHTSVLPSHRKKGWKAGEPYFSMIPVLLHRGSGHRAETRIKMVCSKKA
ncbi:MAG: hypothetical protein V8S37_11665 [Lachnospiraceae bacterium]